MASGLRENGTTLSTTCTAGVDIINVQNNKQKNTMMKYIAFCEHPSSGGHFPTDAIDGVGMHVQLV